MSRVNVRTPEEILDGFKDHSKIPLVLSSQEQESFRNYMQEIGMTAIFGCVELDNPDLDSNPSNIALILSHDANSVIKLKQPGALVGPCMLGEDYYVAGVSIYVPVSTES